MRQKRVSMLKTSTLRILAEGLARMLTVGRCISQRLNYTRHFAIPAGQWVLIAGKVEFASLALG
jgi:hypothetical protein